MNVSKLRNSSRFLRAFFSYSQSYRRIRSSLSSTFSLVTSFYFLRSVGILHEGKSGTGNVIFMHVWVYFVVWMCRVCISLCTHVFAFLFYIPPTWVEEAVVYHHHSSVSQEFTRLTLFSSLSFPVRIVVCCNNTCIYSSFVQILQYNNFTSSSSLVILKEKYPWRRWMVSKETWHFFASL